MHVLSQQKKHTPPIFFGAVEIGQNAISSYPNLIGSQLIAQTIHNDQVYVGSKKKVWAISIKTNKNNKIKFDHFSPFRFNWCGQ